MTRKFRNREDALALLASQNERLEHRVRELENQLTAPPVLPNEFTREAAFELLNTFPEGDAVDYVLLTWNECIADTRKLFGISVSERDIECSEQDAALLTRISQVLNKATCTVCGCTDDHACIDNTTGRPCHWDSLDRKAGSGVCSVCAEKAKRIVPVLPVRDKDGCWRHPDRLTTPFDEIGGTAEQYAEWYGARGMETKFTYMSDVFCEGCAYGESAEFPALHWNPEPPAGSGWILTMIFDTEDAVCAEWIRYTDRAQGGNA
ncbi:hypothetical protein R9X49_22410 [Pectobacterium carotovorum]|uniref:hypothetical protein n=1 Tax=Pectobacterium carotovorum TaxID=554 RepID=UPI0029D642D3|nr:hypothetical protein [Pectobacterium carotovorum]MDX6917854.1 hypothetical protein [Pectobacterium carotovorum]